MIMKLQPPQPMRLWGLLGLPFHSNWLQRLMSGPRLLSHLTPPPFNFARSPRPGGRSQPCTRPRREHPPPLRYGGYSAPPAGGWDAVGEQTA